MIFTDDDNVFDLTSDEAFKLKGLFLAHFMFTTLGLQGYWYPNSYLFYNAFFIGAVLWTLHQNNNGLAMKVAITINQLALLFDIVVLAVYFPSGKGKFLGGILSKGGADIFSAAMAIINLILRPLSFAWMFNLIEKDSIKEPLIGRVPSGYQDIEAQLTNA